MGCVAQVCILVSSSFAARELGDRNDRECSYGFVANSFVAPLRFRRHTEKRRDLTAVVESNNGSQVRGRL
jgi:hypothetical protein